VHCTKISPEFGCQGQGQGHQGQKKRKTAKSFPLTMHSRVCVCAVGRKQQAATDDTLHGRPGVTDYTSGKISACCLVFN